ncbi:hypothetical protein HCG60_11305 [Ligilactobacillus murinus]|uniref:hypothetical protein n=1 Tax=Ligilactobacillus murinus TaxID=1622 RepID=UPI001C8C0B4B|nr:hypothetical protein [Ligilactobacillus murinus]MBX9013599.1 hypothetical protein [Ligilactobacillus murinus]
MNKEKIKLEKELRKVDELWSEVLHNKNLEFWEELVEKKEEFRYLQGNEYFNLLVVMLRDELIDEKYSDYIAYFYEGNLLYSDKKFIRSIFDKGNVGYDYRIEDPKKVIEYITDKDYRRYKILNIDLSAYLIKKGSERYRKALVDIIEENKEYSFLLTLLRRIDESEEIIELFSILSDNQPKMTENIIQSSDIDVSDKIYYMTKYICFAATEDIQNNIEDKVLRDFISANPNFLSSKDIISKRFLEKLEILGKKGVKFPDISNTERNIIEGILNKKVFEINKVNLRAILRFYNIDDTKKEFKNRNYTYFKESLQGKGDDILSFLYENNNIGKYIETYLSLSKLELEDETEDVLKILNDKQVGSDLKKEYIDRLSASVKIPKISDVREKELREKLFIHGNVEESGENIVEAFKQNGEEKDREDELEIDIELISAVVGYINSFKGKVDIEKKLLSSSQTDKLFDAFVVNIELHDDKYIELLKSLNLVYTQGIDSSIPESRIPLLIKNGIISFTSDNLQDMRDNHSDYLVQYIYYNFEKYISIKEDDLLLNDRELESLLQSGLFSLNQEKKIVDNLQNGISIEFEYSDTVKAYILEKAYDENDLKYIVEKFSELGQLSQKVAYRIISTRGLQELTDGEVKPEKSLLMKLLYDSNIENDDRKWIFVNNLKRLSVEEADKQIHNLELPTGFSKALHRGRPRVEKNSLNKEIAEQFQKLEWVTTVTEKGNELYIIGRKMV